MLRMTYRLWMTAAKEPPEFCTTRITSVSADMILNSTVELNLDKNASV